MDPKDLAGKAVQENRRQASRQKTRKKATQKAAPKLAHPTSTPLPPKLRGPARELIAPQDVFTYQHMVETAAYYIAEKKNFAPGCDLDNWLQAESEIKKNAPKANGKRPVTH